jgi:hypothetical protein
MGYRMPSFQCLRKPPAHLVGRVAYTQGKTYGIIGKTYMPIITTKALGLEPEADPKPVTAFDYAGQPIPPGGHYNGRPEHMGNAPESPPARRRGNREALAAYWAKRKAQKASESHG